MVRNKALRYGRGGLFPCIGTAQKRETPLTRPRGHGIIRVPMSVLWRLGWWLTTRAYARPVVSDTPRSRWLFAFGYATPRKLLNVYRVRRDYRRHRVRMSGMPYAIRVDPSGACNLRCPLCPTGTGEIDRPHGMLTTTLFDRVLREVGDSAIVAHLWVWGEPLLNRHIADLVQMATARGIATEISTHLSLPLTDAQIDALIGAGLTWLIVSADGVTSETYGVYRRGGDLDLVVQNIRRFAERKRALRSRTPFVEWQFVPFRHNQHEMAQLPAVARAAGADGVRFKPARLDKVHNLTFDGEVPDELRVEWMPTRATLSHTLDRGAESFLPFHCTFLWNSVTVHPDGRIAPCCETALRADDLGAIDAAAFGETWNGPAYMHARRVALGRTTTGPRIACHGCKVFGKPERAPEPAVAQ